MMPINQIIESTNLDREEKEYEWKDQMEVEQMDRNNRLDNLDANYRR